MSKGWGSPQNNSGLIDDSKKIKKFIDEDIKQNIEFEKDDIVISISNFDTYYNEKGDFIRNATPYSIFPFKISNCIGLLSGKYHLISSINYSEIKRIFISNGWEIIENDIEQIIKENEQKKLNLFIAYYGHIRTLIPETSGQRNGIIRTL